RGFRQRDPQLHRGSRSGQDPTLSGRDAPRLPDEGNSRRTVMIAASQMREHVERVIEENKITYRPVERIRKSKCFPCKPGDRPVVQFVPAWSEITYAVALHELGHVFGRHSDHVDDIVRERDAWDWARDNAVVWSPKMERLASLCMRRANKKWDAWMKVLNAMHERHYYD